MKPQDIAQLKTRPVAELHTMLKESREKLRHLQLDLAAGKVKNEGDLRAVRKDIARILTFIGQATKNATK
ncbi:MAG: 50S ribosomal protein L29 [Patescibacteria group bacterium]